MKKAIYAVAVAVLVLAGTVLYAVNNVADIEHLKIYCKDYPSIDSCLVEAAGRGNAEVVRKLLKAGADVNARDNDSRTALMLAAAYGHPEAIRELLKAGADIEARNYGETAFDWWQKYQKDHPEFQEISNLLRP